MPVDPENCEELKMFCDSYCVLSEMQSSADGVRKTPQTFLIIICFMVLMDSESRTTEIILKWLEHFVEKPRFSNASMRTWSRLWTFMKPITPSKLCSDLEKITLWLLSFPLKIDVAVKFHALSCLLLSNVTRNVMLATNAQRQPTQTPSTYISYVKWSRIAITRLSLPPTSWAR